jgi:menaquinol-cytochrome c reductase cytochrome b subunit
MATRRSLTRQERIQQTILYPVDWIEERSGLVGAVRYFLFRKVPSDVNWFQTLGSATLTAFLVQALTGVVLAMYYQPGPATAYPSIERITNDLFAGWLVRGMHRWGASVFIILLFMHMGRVFLFGAYKFPRELTWLIGVLLLALGLLEGFTGYLLPWDQTAYWATTVGINLNGTGPIIGPFLAQFLQSGTYINPDTLPRFYSLHMLVLPGAIFALVGLHLWLVIRLGVTSPPWSKEAAGLGPLDGGEPSSNGRSGLTRPAPRGGDDGR